MKKLKLEKVNKKTVFLFVGLCILCLGTVLFTYLAFPQIKLNGKSSVELNYKEVYKEKGFKATYLGKDVSGDVKVKGKVNSKKLREYKITYSVKGLFTKKVTRKIKVKDLSKPVIKLSEGKEVYLCPGEKYYGEEYTAVDNYDGDIKDKVKVSLEEDTINYSVVDNAGNKTSITKKLIYQDNDKPVITLTGSTFVYAFVGEQYKELGYSASDNCSGNITNKVKVENNVNIGSSGNYTVKYSVVDDGGNTAVVERTVIVSERGRNGTIYLTFDDGPQNGTTNVILDILKEEGVEATFFVTNKGPDSLIKRMHDEGHTVALHTASHNYATVYASVDAYFADLNSVSARVKRITGVDSRIIRFPGGSSNTVSRRYSSGIMTTLTQEVVNRGYRYYDWNLSSGDAAGGSPTSTQIYNNVVYSLRKDRINMVLMHDIKTYTRDALRDIIRYGKNNGYTFEKITMNTEMVRQRVNN